MSFIKLTERDGSDIIVQQTYDEVMQKIEGKP